MKMGAVAGMHKVKDAARVAWAVMNFTKHTLLVGQAGRQLFSNNSNLFDPIMIPTFSSFEYRTILMNQMIFHELSIFI